MYGRTCPASSLRNLIERKPLLCLCQYVCKITLSSESAEDGSPASDDEVEEGTGFLFGNAWIFTCRHVVIEDEKKAPKQFFDKLKRRSTTFSFWREDDSIITLDSTCVDWVVSEDHP